MVVVYVSVEERDRLQRQAKRHNMPVSRYLRTLGLDPYGSRLTTDALRRVQQQAVSA